MENHFHSISRPGLLHCPHLLPFLVKSAMAVTGILREKYKAFLHSKAYKFFKCKRHLSETANTDMQICLLEVRFGCEVSSSQKKHSCVYILY